MTYTPEKEVGIKQWMRVFYRACNKSVGRGGFGGASDHQGVAA